MHSARRGVCFLALNVRLHYVIFVCTCANSIHYTATQADRPIHSYGVLYNNFSLKTRKRKCKFMFFIERSAQILFAQRTLRWQSHVVVTVWRSSWLDVAKRTHVTTHARIPCFPLQTNQIYRKSKRRATTRIYRRIISISTSGRLFKDSFRTQRKKHNAGNYL